MKTPTVICGLIGGILLFGGCYTPPPAGRLIEETSFQAAVVRSGDLKLLDGISTLTLADAKRIALANNPTYQAAFFAVRSAKMRYYQAMGAYSPALSGAFAIGDQLYDGRDNGSSQQDTVFYTFTTVQASWVVFDGLAREFQLLAARHGVKMQEHLGENAGRLLLQAVSLAYDDIRIAQAQQRIARADADFQQEQYRQAEIRHRVGEVSRSDVLNFAGRLKQAEMQIVKARNRYELGLYALAVLLGYPEGTFSPQLQFAPLEREVEPPLPIDVLLDSALQQRPDLNAVRENLAVLKYQLYRSYSSFSPTMSVFTNYSYSSNSTQNSGNNPTGFGNFYEAGNSFNYGGLASWNLFEGFGRYNKSREAKAELDQAYLTGTNEWLKAVQEIRDAYSSCVHNRKLAELAAAGRDIMREQRDLVVKEYQVGEVDIVRLNAAQENYVVSENELAEALVNAHRAKVQLEAAAALDMAPRP